MFVCDVSDYGLCKITLPPATCPRYHLMMFTNNQHADCFVIDPVITQPQTKDL